MSIMAAQGLVHKLTQTTPVSRIPTPYLGPQIAIADLGDLGIGQLQKLAVFQSIWLWQFAPLNT